MDWKRAAGRMVEILPRKRLHPSVVTWTEGRSLAVRRTWSIGLSGGADSVALLLLLWAHWPERREHMEVLHYNHRLRGQESLLEARFCERLAKALGVPFRKDRWPGKMKLGSEAAARAARFAFFERAMQASQSKALFLGHQQDDVAETMLMRLARGSGTGGLCAPRPLHVLENGRVHVRPLLSLAKGEIAAALKEAGGRWCEDSSNQGRDYLRNRMRLDVIPSWKESAGSRDALAGAALSRDLLEEDDQAMEAWLSELSPFKRKSTLDLGVIEGKPKALYRRALHRWLLSTTYKGDLSRQGFELLLKAVMEGRPTRQSLGSDGFAVIRKSELIYLKS